MSFNFIVCARSGIDRAFFTRRIWTAIVALSLLVGTTPIGFSSAFAQKRSADCKASFMNKCMADCTRRAGRQCDWFCGRRSSYAC
jgi:hypothetical protein